MPVFPRLQFPGLWAEVWHAKRHPPAPRPPSAPRRFIFVNIDVLYHCLDVAFFVVGLYIGRGCFLLCVLWSESQRQPINELMDVVRSNRFINTSAQFEKPALP